MENNKREWVIQPHSTIDKQFGIALKGAERYPFLWLDYDDVDHAEQDATAELIVKAVNNHEQIVKCMRMMDEALRAGLTIEESDPIHNQIQRLLSQLESK